MKILIFTKNWLGDVLFQLPAVEALHRQFPEAEIVCAAPSRCHEILASHPAVSRVLTFDEKKEHRSFFRRLLFGLELRKENWDQVYLFHRSRTRAFIAFLAGARERIGYAKGRKSLLSLAVSEPATPLHHVDYNLHLLRQAGVSYPERACYRFYLPDKARVAAKKILEKNHLQAKSFLCFHLGANWEPKRWPVRQFARLADLLHDRWHIPVVVTGSPKDRLLLRELLKWIEKAQVISIVGETGLSELGAIYEAACCLVTGDSGPMHIASGVGTPVAALFGPTDPNLTGPRGTGDKVILQYVPPGFSIPWYGKDLPKEGWLSPIQPEEVVKAIEEKGWMETGDKTEAKSFNLSPVSCPPPLAVKRILFITLSNIGDVIVTTPVLSILASKFPDAKITVVSGPRAQGVLQRSRKIDRLIIYNKKASLRQKWKFLKALRTQNYDLVIDLKNTAIPFLVTAGKRSPFIRRYWETNMRARHLEVLKMTGISYSEIPPFDFFREEDEISLLGKLKAKGVAANRNWIVIAPAAASELKTWRFEGFQKVIERLLVEREEDIVLVGDKRERDIAEPLRKINPGRIHNLGGETTLNELAALVSRASLVLANDSAVMHLGHELNRPVVAIFGPTNHKKSGYQGPRFKGVREPVFCSPCEQPRCRFKRQSCFEDLQPEKVFKACVELLEAPEALAFRERGLTFSSRILVTRADRIGDLVLSTPIFQAIREKFPDSWIAGLTFCENREILEGNPYLNEVILYDKKGSEKGVFGNLRFARKLARKKFDTVIHLHATNRMHWVTWLAGIPVRIGYDRKCAWGLTEAHPDLKSEGKKHEAEYNFDLLKSLGIKSSEQIEPFFPLSDKARHSLNELLNHLKIPQDRPWVILNPSASCPSKIWPAERFGYLADAVAKKYEIIFLAIGSREDRQFVQKAKRAALTPIFDLIGRLSLGMLGVLLSRASLLISNDSGPVHIANAVGTPAISIFGRSQPGLSPARWGPLGRDSRVVWKDVGCVECLAHNCEIGFLCLDAISVDDVLREVDHYADVLRVLPQEYSVWAPPPGVDPPISNTPASPAIEFRNQRGQ